MDRIEQVDKLFHQITEMLPMIYDEEVDDEFKETHFLTDSNRVQILSTERDEVETIANLFDQLYDMGTCVTGYYDPAEDERNNEVDAYTGLYYVTIR